ncbi:MAG: His/Gly/Thr/Pro-type tRNA ligase C-terminal domain-containing protein [bacterium]
MTRIIQVGPLWQLREFDRPLVTASYFGFIPIVAPRVNKEDLSCTEECGTHPHYDAAEKSALIRTYLTQGLVSEPHPLSIAYRKHNSPRNRDDYSLHFIGSDSGVADATLIRSALSVLTDAGRKHLILDINSIGDKESIATYERELHSHVRKYISDLPEETREQIKKNVFSLFHLDTPEIHVMRHGAPSSVSFLSAQSRNHFKDVLEYVEALGIEFRLIPELVGNKHYCSNTIFAIRDTSGEEEETVAVGYHYSKLGRRLGVKREIPMAGVTLFLDRNKTSQRAAKLKSVYKELPRTKFCLVQLGREAKMKSLPLLERLRHEHIRVHHLIGKDKIAVQLSSAERLSASHIILLGQKEALDNTAIVRNVVTRAQGTVSMNELPHYLKHLPI